MKKQVYTLVVDFSIQGNLAYLSHQETLKMFQRALIRASVPLAFSMGFNPHPRLSIPFPRSVGTQSSKDRLCAMVEMPECSPAQDWSVRIQEHLPADCSILSVQSILGKCQFYPEEVRYLFSLDTAFDAETQGHLDDCRRQIEEGCGIEIQRYWAKKRRYKKFDMAPYLKEMDFANDQIKVACGISQSGTVRVDEIMQWLNVVSEQFREPVCRTEISWRQN